MRTCNSAGACILYVVTTRLRAHSAHHCEALGNQLLAHLWSVTILVKGTHTGERKRLRHGVQMASERGADR